MAYNEERDERHQSNERGKNAKNVRGSSQQNECNNISIGNNNAEALCAHGDIKKSRRIMQPIEHDKMASL